MSADCFVLLCIEWLGLYYVDIVCFESNVVSWGFVHVVIRSTNERDVPSSWAGLEEDRETRHQSPVSCQLLRCGGDQFCQISFSTLELPCCLSLQPTSRVKCFISWTGLFLRKDTGGWSLSRKNSPPPPLLSSEKLIVETSDTERAWQRRHLIWHILKVYVDEFLWYVSRLLKV